MKPKVLVVEDDPIVLEIIQLNLPLDGWEVLPAQSGVEARAVLAEQLPDVIVLDRMLPDMRGADFCAQLRRGIREDLANIPILMLTAMASQADKLAGFAAGADDYLTKPFDPRELDARLKALVKRTNGRSLTDQINLKPLTIHPQMRKVRYDGETIDLKPQEFDLLLTLAQNPGQVFSRRELLEVVWGYAIATDSRTVDMHISRLRKKLKKYAPQQDVIQTVHGVGYKLEVEGATS